MNSYEMLWVSDINDFFFELILLFDLGASAGAGSGEFDIYRGCRRRQIIREAYLSRVAKEVRFDRMKFDFEMISKLFRKKKMKNGNKKLKKIRKKPKVKQLNDDKNGWLSCQIEFVFSFFSFI